MLSRGEFTKMFLLWRPRWYIVGGCFFFFFFRGSFLFIFGKHQDQFYCCLLEKLKKKVHQDVSLIWCPPVHHHGGYYSCRSWASLAIRALKTVCLLKAPRKSHPSNSDHGPAICHKRREGQVKAWVFVFSSPFIVRYAVPCSVYIIYYHTIITTTGLFMAWFSSKIFCAIPSKKKKKYKVQTYPLTYVYNP